MQSRQTLELRQRQQLALTPQLQQSIRLLQYSAQELQQEVAQALLENPLLEPDEEYDTEVAQTEPGQAQMWLQEPSWNSRTPRNHDEWPGSQDPALPATLEDHLLDQLRMTRASQIDRLLVSLLVHDLDENGYLVSGLEEFLEQLPAEHTIGLEELRGALALLQSFDPPGVGARSLSECLLLQLASGVHDVDDAVLQCARQIARDHLNLLASGSLARLQARLGCSELHLRAAHGLLLRLDPKPGRQWAGSVADSIIPEILVRKVAGRWTAYVNPQVRPRIRVNRGYEAAIRELRAAAPSEGAAADRVQGEVLPELHLQVQQAYGFIRSVGQRFDTMLRVAQAIVDTQRAFFEYGVQAMRPLVLRDIAEELGMHESTVSRATQQKYAQTPWGVYELKHFFGASLAGTRGDAASATAVKALLQQLVAEEPASKPLSDSQLAACLAERGVIIARRTVAKYREEAGILPKSQRKAQALLREHHK